MSDLALTRAQARRFMLAHQNLWPPRALHGKAGVLEHMHRVRCIQFDPLNIAGRNPELVLQSRVVDFQPAMLDELLYRDRRLLDGWDKMMSIYPVEDWPYFRRRREGAKNGRGRSRDEVDLVVPAVRRELEARGPLSSLDLDFEKRVDWPWGVTRVGRAALESLWDWGELIVHHKINTRKVYDFAHRHILQAVLSAPDPNETLEQYHEWYVLRRLGSVGLVRAGGGSAGAWLGLPGIMAPQRALIVERLLARGDLLQLDAEGLPYPCHIRREDRAILDRVLCEDDVPLRAAIIAPLDNLIWDRQFIGTLFDFSYTWEVYKPAAQREYGYYVLPVLYGDRFVARFEPGREKKNGALTIANWWWEEGVTPDADMQCALGECFARFLAYLGRDKLVVSDDALAQADLDWLRDAF
ncbi:MAG: YcaQ family DNA glycosylase [Anaerolineae bacterium]|nr:YcaQ family DNA glycosylase [Anaerolineae bacterium]